MFGINRIILIILLGLVIFLVLFFIWANFFYFKTCPNQDCFNDNLVKCSRARYVFRGNITFEFKIIGPAFDECKVDVKFLRGDLNKQDLLALKGKTMRCMLPMGVITGPLDDISLCSGKLKEGLQDLIIKKMHTYIVQNLERINFDIF